jgi:outer membrane usher protein
MMLAAALWTGAAGGARGQTPSPAPNQAAGSIELLDVKVNGWPLELVGEFHVTADARIWLTPEEYGELGFKPDEALVNQEGGQRRIYLDKVPGLKWSIDRLAQTIDFQAPFERLARNRLAISPGTARAASKADWGGLFTYDAFGEWSVKKDDQLFGRSISTNLEARLFSPFFTARTTGFVSYSAGAQPSFIRLDSYVDFDDPDRTRRLTLGDATWDGPSYFRTFRFGGVQWGTDFGLRPDIITTPMPVMPQNVSAPSSVDVFVNGVSRLTRNLDPGAFVLTDLPVVTGANSIQITLTDKFGRRTTSVLPLYTSPELLAAGLSEYSLAAGVARHNYASVSSDYDGLFASGRFAHGVSDKLTLEGDFSAAPGFFGAAASANLAVASQILAFAAISADTSSAGFGHAWWAGLERSTGKLSLYARYMHSTADYQDLPFLFGEGRLRDEATVSASWNMGKLGSFNLAYALQRPPGTERSEVLTTTYRVNLFHDRASFSATSFGDLTHKQWGGLLSLVFQLGSHSYGNLQAEQNEGQRVLSLHLDGQSADQRFDWSASLNNGPLAGGYVQANLDGRHIDLYGRVADVKGSVGIDAEVGQSFVFMDHRLFLADRIEEGFTVVDVQNSPGVMVSLANRPYGRTNTDGTILLNTLEPYAGNLVSIRSLDLPLDAQPKATSMLVAPREGAGVVAHFTVKRERSALVVLRLADGKPVPVGSAFVLNGADGKGLVGYDGEAFVEGIRPGKNRIEVDWQDGRCSGDFETPAVEGRLDRLGPVTCAP